MTVPSRDVGGRDPHRRAAHGYDLRGCVAPCGVAATPSAREPSSVTPMRRVIELSRCRRDGGTFVEVDGRELAVFRFGDPERVVVTDNACPHASGNLSGGSLQNGAVVCPWHAWTFDLTTGVCTRSPDARIHLYPAEVRDGVVHVAVD